MATKKQKTVSRVSDLPIINKIWDGMKTIVAKDRENFVLNVKDIEGRKILDMSETKSEKSGGKNVIYFNFNDGISEKIYVYNGGEGEQGEKGKSAEDGNQGENGYINPSGRGITGVLYIVNNSDTNDPNLPWSAYRGKDMNDKIYELNETFVSDTEFNLLFNSQKYINALFSTTTENQVSNIFNTDKNSHIVYKKYWTYEDEGGRTYYIYNPNSNEVDEAGNIVKHYDTVEADLWKDIYLGNTSGYFLISNSMHTDSTDIYYYDKESNTYKLVEKVINKKENEEGELIDIYLGDKYISNYYIPEIDAYVSGKYTIVNNKWEIELNSTSIYVPDVYTTLDNIIYTKLSKEEVLAIDTTLYAQYYKKDNNDNYSLITDINKYITPNAVRYYKRNVIEDNGEYIYTKNNKYCEVPESEINYDSLKDDFLIVSFDKVSNNYTFTRYYPGELYGEPVQFNDTINMNSIDLYYYTDSRIYYVNVLTRNSDGTYDSEYVPVEIPNWIYAEYKTYDEDQNSIILNANINTYGHSENNEFIDTTLETLDSTVETDNIFRIVPGKKDNLYIKTGDNRYELVNLAKDTIYYTSEYYSWDGSTTVYKEISGTEALSNNNVYEKKNNTYSLYTGTINVENNYWIKIPNYIKVEDPETYISTYDLVLFTDEPTLLPITIYPASNRSYVKIEYDADKFIFYENGRIAAAIDKDYETVIKISSENSSAEAYVNVKVTTPLKEIAFNENNKTSVDVNNDIDFYYSVGPDNASNKDVVWIYDDEYIEIISLEPNELGNRVKIHGKKAGFTEISASAADTYGAMANLRFEVTIPAASMNWDTDNELIKYYPPIYWTNDDAELYNHDENNTNNPDFIPVHGGDLKEAEYYELIALLYKEYVLSDKINILPNDTTYKDIIWESSNSLIAEVLQRTKKIIEVEGVRREITIEDINENVKDANGNELTLDQVGTIVTLVNEKSYNTIEYYLTSYKIGNVKITGYLERYPDLKIYINVRVDQSIEEILITPDVLSLNVNTKKKLTAEILPDTAVNGTISWHSTDTSIVTVSPTGTINALQPGNTTVIAKAEDGSGVQGVCNVKVTIPSKDILLNGEIDNGIIYLGIGKTTTITANIIHSTDYGYNNTYTNNDVTWLSTDESVATIDRHGLVTGVSIGKVTIIANAKDNSGVFGSIQLRVIQLTESIEFNFNEVEMEVSDSLVLIPIFEPANTSNEIVIWHSSDETIAKVKESGIVYALSPGTVEITATTTDGTNLTATCTVTIL